MSSLYCLLFVAFLGSLQTISADPLLVSDLDLWVYVTDPPVPGAFNDVDPTSEKVLAPLKALNSQISSLISQKYPGRIGVIEQPPFAAQAQFVSNRAHYRISFILNRLTDDLLFPPQINFTASIDEIYDSKFNPNGQKYQLIDVVNISPVDW